MSMTFWPNPVCRNHTGEMRWYFNVALRAADTTSVHLYRYRGEWYDLTGQLQDTKEAALDLHLAVQQSLSYPDLWVTSAISSFRYRLIVYGRDANSQEVRAEAMLECQ
ncbi:hypothetical protein NKDENANG_01601 [Candidatus Entotheonellaceae bacterium PAL068K]